MSFLEFLGTMPGALNLGLIWAIAGIGVYITFKILDIPDLTVDGSFITGGLVSSIIIINGGHFMLALVLGFIAGLLCGMVTGLLHTLLGIPAILAGILTQLALWSVNLIITKNKSIVSIPVASYQTIMSQSNPYDALWKCAIIVGLIILVLYWFFGTKLGCSIRATGNNQKMSKAQGINTKLNIVIALALSNGIVGLSGAVYTQYYGMAEINMGKGAIVICLSAIVIGGLIFSKFAKNFAVRLSSVIVGSVIYYIIYQSVINFGLEPNLMKLFTAIVVAIFLGIPYVKRHYIDGLAKRHQNRKIKSGGN